MDFRVEHAFSRLDDQARTNADGYHPVASALVACEHRRSNPGAQLRRMRVPPRPLPPEPPPPPPPPGIELVHYTGPAGKLSAYLHVPKDRKRRHPALLWCHGGFGGINHSQWRFSASARGEVGPLFADSDFVVLSPAWRGEAGSDGEPEIAKLSALKPGAQIEITQAEVAAALAADPR